MKMKEASFHVPTADFRKMNQLIDEGLYTGRSAFIRAAIFNYIQNLDVIRKKKRIEGSKIEIEYNESSHIAIPLDETKVKIYRLVDKESKTGKREENPNLNCFA